MSAIWQFTVKYEFWVLMLLVLGLYVGEQKLAVRWLGELGFFVFLVAGTRLAMHPMWKKGEQGNSD